MIKLVTHPYPVELLQARIDEAIVTGRPMVERPFYFEHTKTRLRYYDIFGCLGWPTEISAKDQEGRPGYVGIVGVVKSDKIKPEDAQFQLLAESEHRDVPSLIMAFISMRRDYGHGLTPDTLQYLFGDPDRFPTTMALINERLIAASGEKAVVTLASPDDFYDPKAFDNYMRSLRSCLDPERQRLYYGENKILLARLREFRADDPAVMAVGGMVHSLMARCMWMGEAGSNIFNLEEDDAIVNFG